jgi:uncharacterized membrane protein
MTGRASKLFLLGSLLLNVFLFGAIAGGAYRWVAAERPAAVAPVNGLRFATQDLSIERQKQFRQMLRQTRRDSLPLAEASRDGRIEVARLLSAASFDRGALDAALARTRSADIERRKRLEDGIASFAQTLTLDERLKLADGVARWGSFRLPPKAGPKPPP